MIVKLYALLVFSLLASKLRFLFASPCDRMITDIFWLDDGSRKFQFICLLFDGLFGIY